MKIQLNIIDKTSEIIRFSAGEASSYLSKMLPEASISIIYNNEAIDPQALAVTLECTPEDGNDRFLIDVAPSGGRISGSNDRSVLIGVYHYLYLLGCRFLGPRPECEAIPVLEGKHALYRSCSLTARLKHRGVCLEGANSLENILSFVAWLPKLGYNSFFLQFQIPYTFMARWYHHEMNPLLEPEFFTRSEAAAFTAKISDEMKRRGLLLHQAGHGWTGDSIGLSSMDWKETAQTLDERQTQMLAQLGGERKLFHGVPMNTNLCYSSPDVVEAFSDHVVHYARQHRDIDYLHVWLADEANNVCECERCAEGTLPDQYVHILNRIDEKLTEQRLNTRIVFLLYQELLWPPQKESFKNPDRFVLMFAPISRTFDSPYEISKELPQIPEYRRNQIVLPENLNQNLAFLRAWQKLFSGDSFIYDYPLGRAHYGDFGYVHISKIISEDITRLKQLNLNGYISCQELRSGTPNFLPNYVMGRLLFDDSLDFSALTEEYFKAAYPDCQEKAFQYLSSLSALCSCDYFNGKGSRVNEQVAGNMTLAARLWQEFSTDIQENQANSDSEQPVFQKILDYHSRFIILLEQAVGCLASGRTDEAQALWDQFQHLICSLETQYQPFLDVYRITEVSSKYTGFKLTEALKKTL